jgi:NAD(P)-dependent dehydrogenase (short-subunit alcohol dehydrogenase family)
MNRFKKKRILITGGTSGIGLATAKRIVEEGGEVAVTGMTQEHLDKAGRELPGPSLVLKNDASSLEDIENLENKVKEQMGELDGLFLNAGFGKFAPVSDLTESHIDEMFDVNVKGLALHFSRLQKFLKNGSSVTLTSSIVPYLGQPEGSIYAASKGAVSAMTRSFASALADKKIRVNAICPGPIETNFFSSTGASEDEKEEMKERIQSNVPLGRFGQAEEVAALACFLLSDESKYITGTEMMIDGGMTLR